MGITQVQSTTFLSDTINLIRDKIKNGIEDPIFDSRPSGQKLCYTSYPQNAVTYPIISIVDRGINQVSRLGMASEGALISLNVEIRIWARNVKERDGIFDSVYSFLRQDQLDATSGLADSNLHDFQLLSAVNIDEDGEGGPRSKVCEYQFLIIVD